MRAGRLLLAVCGWSWADPVSAQAHEPGPCNSRSDQAVVWNFSDTTRVVIDPRTINQGIDGVREVQREMPRSLRRSTYVECNRHEEHARIANLQDVTDLVQKGIIMVIVGEKDGISHYILSYRPGAAGRLTFNPCSGGPGAAADYLTRLKAYQMAAIALYELGRIHVRTDAKAETEAWCRVRAAKTLLGQAIALLEPAANKGPEDQAFLAELHRKLSATDQRIALKVSQAGPDGTSLLLGCGASREALTIAGGSQAGGP
jgi:hypothetical protein